MRHLSRILLLVSTLLVPASLYGDQIRLQEAQIDTTPHRRAFAATQRTDSKLESALQITLRKRKASELQPYLLQLSGPVRAQDKAALTKAGLTIVGYVPDNALLIRATPAAIERALALDSVQWVGDYQAAYRVQKEIAALARRAVSTASTQSLNRAKAFAAPEAPAATPDRARASDYPEPAAYEEPKMLTLIAFAAADLTALKAHIVQEGGTVVASVPTRDGGILRARLAPTAAVQMAGLPAVRWIEPYREPKLLNNVAAQGPRMNAEYAWTNFFLTGSNQIIAVCDTGLDSGNTNTIHPDFSNKIHRAFAHGRIGDWMDFQGHGTHVSGSVLGSGKALSNGLYKGIAHDAKLVIQSVMDEWGTLAGLPEDLNELFLEAYTNDARIHSDSWGASVDGAYTVDSRAADEFLWNHQDMLILFAASNDGADSLPTGNPDGVVDEDSLGAPGTAKNVMTVGAAENARTNGGYSTRTYGIWGYPVAPLSNDLISSSFDGTNQGMAAFSSRGPCDDGRTKPDIVAPGTDIISCRSRKIIGSPAWGAVDGTTNYMYSGGTSMATPLTAGAAGLVRQYLVERRGITNPAGALIKAMMLNGARTLSPGQYGEGAWREIPDQARPNNVEGWGHVNLGETLQPPAGRTNALHTGQVATGQTNTYTFISTHTNTLSVVLAWYDYPGELAAAVALVNDLDLRVITPQGQEHVGNGVPGGDRLNNVEGLDVFPLTPGTTVVQVVGYNVPQGTNQSYALVVRESPQSYTFKLQRAIHEPWWPTNNEAISLQTFVQSGVGGVGGVTNFYRINTGTWVEVAATPASGYGPGIVYTHALGGQPIATRVDYYAVAYDSTGAAQNSATTTFYVADIVAYVKTNGIPVPPYNTWATAATDITAAASAVIPGGIVWVTNGVYDGNVVIRKSCTVKSVNGPEVTIIDGRGTNRCVKMDGVVYSVLDGFTLTNGVTPNGDILGDKAGGGVLLREYAVVQNCIITGNRGMYGGGAACYNSKFRYEAGTISNCVIEGNFADTYYGGGVRLAYGGYLTHSLVRNNRGKDTAGGVYFEGLGGYMENSLISGNVATSGLALGGGVEMYGGGCMANCTIVSNRANHRGGVNFVMMGEMENTIVWSNRQVSGFDVDDENGHDNMNRRAYYSCAAGLILTNSFLSNTTNHPLFANFSAGDYRLTPSSPCRDTGIKAFWLELYREYQFISMEGKSDLDGTDRIKNGTVDMGAYELLYLDTDPPVVNQLSPADNSSDVDPTTDLVLTFNENVYAGPGGLRLYRGDGTLDQSFDALDAAVSIAGGTATVTPTNLLAYTNAYYVLVDTNAFRDAATNWFAGIAATSDWNFATRDIGTLTTNTLRIDFGLTGAPVEADGSWQGFELPASSTVKATNRVYALGSSTVSVTLVSDGFVSGRDRANPSADAGALTYSSVYRDMATTAGSYLDVVVSGLVDRASVTLRGWMYDYQYANTNVFTLTDRTDGRSDLIGQVTNVTGAGAKPTNNTMYSVSGTILGGSNGTLTLRFTGDSPARFNGLELLVTEETIIITNTLTIASAHGMADPAVGAHSYVNGSLVTCALTNTPIIQSPTQLVCTGWTGSGSVPASGSGTSVTFTITNTSTLTWLWTTNVEAAPVSNLTVDSSFHPEVGNRIVDMDVDADGRILIVGSFTNIGSVHRQSIARLFSTGLLDTNLTLGAGYGDHDWATTVLCHTNGSSYVGGTLAGNLVRFNEDGGVDTNFPSAGILDATDNMVDSLLQLADNGVLVGGAFLYAMDEEHAGLARLNATGGIVSAFAPTLDGTNGNWNSVYALAAQTDGKLLIGGEIREMNGVPRGNLGRLNADGSLDTAFTNGVSGPSPGVHALLMQTNGLLVGGIFTAVNGTALTNLARFTAADTLDTGFAVSPNSRVNALLALPDGRTLMGGNFTAVNGAAHPGLAMLKADGSLDESFTMGVSGSVAGVVYALHLDHDNGVLVAGEFDYLGNSARANLGRLQLGPSTNTPPSTNTFVASEYWAGINQDGHARNASGVTLDGDLRVRWARSLTNFNDTILQARTNYAGQRGNGLAIRDGRILALVPNATNPLANAVGQYYASFGTFALNDGTKLHETITPHVGAGTRGAAALQDSDLTYGYVNFYWNREDTVFTGYGADIGRSYAFDAYSGTLAPYTPFARMAESPNGSGYFAMTYDNPLVYARGALNTHYSYSKARAGIVGAGEQQIDAMKHYNAYLVNGWDVFGFAMTHYTDDSCFPNGLGTKLTNYRFTNSPYGVVTNWTGNFPSNTFAGFGLHHVRGAPRPLALGTDGRIYYYGFRNTMSGSTPTAADYASGMRLFAVNATNGAPLFEINTGWNPDGDAGLASTATWGTERYHYFLPQISVLSNRVMVLHPQVNKGHGTNLWTRGRLFCFDTATTSLAWSVTYTNNAFDAKVRMDDVVYNPANYASPNCMWGDNTEQAVQLTIAGSHGYVVDPGIQGGGASGPLQLTIYRYALADGSVTVTNLVPVDENAATITAYAERMVNLNDNTNRVALRELAAVDGTLVALVDVDLKAQALVVIEGASTMTNDAAPAAAITSPYAGIPPALQTFNDHRGATAAKTNVVPVLNRLGTPQMRVYDTGAAVSFDAAGSVDPDGGTLTYSWSFGDGSTGSGATTSHGYASWGGAPAISNITVQLTVTDNEGNTNTTTRSIWVRDVGSSATTTLTASADGYIYTAGSLSNNNFGTAQDLEIRRIDHGGLTQEVAYLKFDLTGIDVATVTDAVLRVYVMTPKEFQLEAHATSNGWTESTLRGTNAPAIGVRLGDVITSGYDPLGTWSRAFHQWVEIPVLAHVKDTAYGTERSFAIVATNANASPLELASRNNTTWPNSAPKLILRTGSTGHGGPAITSAPAPVIVYTNTTTQTLSVAASSTIGATNLTYSWRQVSGPARATLSTLHSTGVGSTTVSIPAGGGTYVFRCVVDDGLLYNEAEVTFQETEPEAPAKRLFVILLGGQSNARGYGYQQYLVDSTNALADPQTDVDFYFSPTAYMTQYVLTNLMSGSGFPEIKGTEGVNQQYEPQSYPVNRFGPELSLGRTIRDRIQVESSKVAVIKFAQSGTSLYNDWKPDGTTNKTADGTVYQSFHTTVRNGITALTNAYPDYQLEFLGMGWVQGEADAVDAAGTEYTNYEANLTTFITDIRATYGSNIIFALSKLSSNQYPITHLTEVRAAQEAVAATVTNTYATETLGTNYPVATGFAEAGLHYLSTAMVQIGVDLANAIMDGTPLGGVPFALTSEVNNVNWGSVSPSGGTYSSGTVVQVTATASNGYHFANWTGDASGTTNPLSLTMDAAKSITAVFEADPPPAATTNTLTVVSAYGTPTPSGTNLYTNGSAIACSIGGSPVDQVTTQLVATGWTLAGNSPASGSTTNFDLTLTNSATLTWLWTTNVQFTRTAGAHGTISGATSGWYALGASVTVTAAADSGYTFAGWSGDVSGDTNALAMPVTMDRTRSLTANFQSNAVSGAGLVWRVDFNGSSSDTLAVSNFTGWTVSSTSRTQSFANVDGGSVSSSITVRLLGTGTFNTYQRTMNAGSATNLYRDGAQNTAPLTLALSNLTPSASYTLRVWYFDDEFTLGTTQTYINVTDGGSTTLGALTNTYTGNAAGGHASLPNSLYDNRYVLTAALTAGTNGQINVSITPNSGNGKINAFELAAPAAAPEEFTLTVHAATGGSVSPTGGTYTTGTEVPVTATASQYFHFVSWTGDVQGTVNPTNLVVTSNLTVWAVFAETTYTNDTPEAWLDGYQLPTSDAGALGDTDGDGMLAWEEFIAGTIPTNGASRLWVTNHLQQAGGTLLRWPVVTGRTYHIHHTLSLPVSFTQLATNVTGGVFTDTVHGAEQSGFYRIHVERNP